MYCCDLLPLGVPLNWHADRSAAKISINDITDTLDIETMHPGVAETAEVNHRGTRQRPATTPFALGHQKERRPAKRL